ncbi:MAG: transposase [Campylobacterales bacterium]|nr:transposase [Campylobacterales bacterium]HES59438.1 transposase [Caldithrix sp.]
MPRKPRIEIPGYYHIINRGVEQRVVFKESEDYEYFIELLCLQAKNYSITIHNYCLMSNHYHLLVEIKHENLSKFMRQINSNYAVYFNKKYHRSGHLWQGRFKSWYVTDEAYLYTLILYIEQNPIKANIVQRVEAYPYSSAHLFLQPHQNNGCLRDAWVTQHYRSDIEAIKAFLDSKVDTGQLYELKKASSLVESPNTDKKPNEGKLKKILSKAKDTKERNSLILKAYQEGYSQHMMAKVLELNQATVQRIIKRTKRDDSISIT